MNTLAAESGLENLHGIEGHGVIGHRDFLLALECRVSGDDFADLLEDRLLPFRLERGDETDGADPIEDHVFRRAGMRVGEVLFC